MLAQINDFLGMNASAVEVRGFGFIDLHDFAAKSYLLKPLQNFIPSEDKEFDNALSLWEAKSFEDSLKHCYKLYEGKKDSLVNQLLIVLNYVGLGKRKDALDLLKKVESAKATNNDIKILSLLVASTVYLETQAYNKVIVLTQKITNINPKFYQAYFVMGLAYAQQGKHAKAIKFFRKSLKGKTNIFEIRAKLAHSYFKNKNYLKSFWVYRKISSKFDNNYQVLYRIAISYLTIGKYKDAQYFLDKAERVNPDFSGIYLTRGYLKLKLGNASGAKSDLENAKLLGSKKAANLLEKYNHHIHRLFA